MGFGRMYIPPPLPLKTKLKEKKRFSVALNKMSGLVPHLGQY
jgi:hypothetical protein